MKILGISGSLRENSFNTALLRTARKLAPVGMEIEIADLTGIPPYNEDVYAYGFPAAVETFRGQIAAANGLLIATPEYNYSYSGVLKNAIDWASRPPEQPFNGKAVAMMGASAGRLGTARAQYHLRQVFVFLNGHVVNKPEVMVGGAGQAFDAKGTLLDDGAKELIGQLLVSLQDMSGRMASA
ncbi:MAG: NAD(P)H-dependent oxidoreductase [Proteobacteria bacterium]|nr:NAD(P)H-dependent oxidoreductase [Pseudomonadota bacterium]